MPDRTPEHQSIPELHVLSARGSQADCTDATASNAPISLSITPEQVTGMHEVSVTPGLEAAIHENFTRMHVEESRMDAAKAQSLIEQLRGVADVRNGEGQ